MSDDPACTAPVLVDAQEAVRGLEKDCLDALVEKLSERDVVVCTEVGAGVVPIDPEERAFREAAGRLAVALAKRARCVVRVVCGLPQVLKGNLPRTGGVLSSSAGLVGGAAVPDDGAHLLAGGCDADSTMDERGAIPEHDAVSKSEAHVPQNVPRYLSIYRHAPTRANRAHRYQGAMDEPLDWEGEQVAYAIEPSRNTPVVYVSPLSRSRQTARILFPEAKQVVVDGLSEMNFGEFDGFTYQELSSDSRYQDWVDSGCITKCPGGESRADFVGRIAAAIRVVLRDAQARGLDEAVVVAHGGTAMAAFSAFTESERDYFDWHVDVCGGLRARIVCFDGEGLLLEEPLPVLPSQSL